jgi:hypothetical protein
VAGVFVLAALAMWVTPAGVFDLLGVREAWEVQMLRWAGLFLLAQAALLARMNRHQVKDDRWGRVVVAGDITMAMGVLYFVGGNPLFLLLALCSLIAITLRTLMPVLDHWSADVRGRFEES